MTSPHGRYVVVPHRPGPVIDLDDGSGERRDELDELIDELFPDVDEGPGPFDAGLVVVGLALVGWAVLADGPGWSAWLGALALGLGCVLPVRSAWRRIRHRSAGRRREAVLADGALLDATAPSVASMVRSYEALFVDDRRDDATVEPELLGRIRAAGHAGLSEVASLLEGRAPSTAREQAYVQERAQALAALVEETARAASRRPVTLDALPPDPDALVEAREELDRIAPFSTLDRIRDLTDELERGTGGTGG